MPAQGERYLVWGAGGHGKVVADIVRACGGIVAGFIDADSAKVGSEVGGASVRNDAAGFEKEVRRLGRCPDNIDAVALGIGGNRARLDALGRLAGCRVPPLVHPSAVVSLSATFGRGAVVGANAVVNADARVGAGVIINTAAIVEHDCEVADGAHVSPGAVLAGGVRVGARSWIGAGAVVIQNVNVAEDVTVGAGSVVVRDVPGGVTVVGVPARVLKGSG